MQTVQVAIRDSEHACSLRDLLLVDGVHQVHLVERPNLAIAGVIVMDLDHLDRSGALAAERERLVVMASKARIDLARVWKAGVRHVVFRGDAPRTVRVAVLATELTLLAPNL
jgi:aspartate 1-decarboxylase